MNLRNMKRIIKRAIHKAEERETSEPSLIDLTHDDELMDRALKKAADAQNEILKQAEAIKKEQEDK